MYNNAEYLLENVKQGREIIDSFNIEKYPFLKKKLETFEHTISLRERRLKQK